MRRLFSIAAMVLALAAMAFVVGLVQASPAAADGDDDGDDRTLCTGALSGTIDGNLVVPGGVTCELTDAHVTGDLVVQATAVLLALNSRIEGDVECSAGFVPPDGVFASFSATSCPARWSKATGSHAPEESFMLTGA
jgi:hypothetical protein